MIEVLVVIETIANLAALPQPVTQSAIFCRLIP
jgi:hypothetical protein